MNLILLNLQSDQEIQLDNESPLLIGRGNIQGCTDKRVSRHHGRITCTVDGKIHLEALHSNPCFFTRNGIPPVVQLNKNEVETLKEGDCLGFLPNAFWFQITSKNRTNIKSDNNSSSEVGLNSHSHDNNESVLQKTDNLNVNEVQIEKVVIKEPEASNSSENENSVPSGSCQSNSQVAVSSSSSHLSDSAVKYSSLIGTPEFEKTKRLPLWMYEIDGPNKRKNPGKRAFPSCEETTQAKKRKNSTEEKSEPVLPESCSSSSNSEDVQQGSKSASTSTVEVNSSKPASMSRSESPEKQSLVTNGESSSQNQTKEGYESDVNNEASTSNPKRPLCQYEEKCYRQNPQHKLDFCHPGDADFIPYEDRPLCQYGAACYRKNAIHKVEFRHPEASSQTLSSPSSCSCRSASPLPPKRRRKTVQTNVFDFEDDFDSDQADPYFTDASSDEFLPDDASLGYDTSFDYSQSDVYLDDIEDSFF